MAAGWPGRARSRVAATGRKALGYPHLLFGTRRIHLLFGASNIPHPDKAAKGGEDAYFYDERTCTFGVADGVGGSASEGVDPGLFSRALLRQCVAALDGSADGLRAALSAAGRDLCKNSLGGASTLLIGNLEPLDGADGAERGALHVLNVGDCGALLLRPATRRFRQGGTIRWPRLVARTHEQTWYFNCPYQLSVGDAFEQAEDADELRALAQPGDVLIVATDGCLDNLWEVALQTEVAKRLGEIGAHNATTARQAIDALAAAIGEAAAATGRRENEKSLSTPFSAAAAKEGLRFDGGKLDDVCVVVGVVRSGPPPAELRRRGNF